MITKKGLGRGLESLFAMYEEEVGNENITNQELQKSDTSNVNEINIDQIDPNPNQPRKFFDENALNELAESIKIHGVIQPLVLNKLENGRFLIIAGERRFRASKLAGLKTIPAIIKNYSNKQIKEIAIIENLQREDLNPIEAARAIKQLMDEYQLTQETVSERIGKSRSNVANTIRLLSLYPDVISLVENGKLSAGHARALVGINDANIQIKLANQAIQNQWNVRDLEKAVKKSNKPFQESEKIKNLEQSIELKDLVNQMQRVLATKVSAIGNDNKGRIYIDYYSRDDLDRLCEYIAILNNRK